MFSTSKVGGSRGSTTFITGLAPPSYTHHPAVQPSSSFIDYKRLTKVKLRSSANLRGGLPLFTEKKTEKSSSRKLADQALVL